MWCVDHLRNGTVDAAGVKGCFEHPDAQFIAALAAAALLLLCCAGCVARRFCCRGRAAEHGQTAESYLADIGRESVVQQLMRRSQWGTPSECQPLLSPDSVNSPGEISPSTRLLRSPLVRSQLNAAPSARLGSGGTGMVQTVLSSFSFAKKGAQELINNENFHEAIVEEDPIACGATGDVVKGVWRGKQMAIKILQVQRGTLSKAETDKLIESFRREIIICCQVRHVNLVDFYGYTCDPRDTNGLRICMEFVAGGALDTALYKDSARSSGTTRRRWTPTHSQVLDCALGVAQGMAHLHGNGVIHRDLKSPNLLLNTAPTGPWRKTQDSCDFCCFPRCFRCFFNDFHCLAGGSRRL